MSNLPSNIYKTIVVTPILSITLDVSQGSSIGMLKIGIEDGGALYARHLKPMNEKLEHSYLLPASVAPKGIDVMLPLFYKTIISVLLFIWHERQMNILFEDFIDDLPLSLQLKLNL